MSQLLVFNLYSVNTKKKTDTKFNSGKEPEVFDKALKDTFNINAVAYAHLFNYFMPLVLQGNAKKVIALSTGLADLELTRDLDLWMAIPYCVSKAALNMVIAKFSAEYREKGVLVLGMSPGVVATNDLSDGELPSPISDSYDY